jgi:two-component system OmpR family sensor kinase/two-component system sensor histidine kinase BaeS
MRWRLFLAFVIIVLVSVISLTLLINSNISQTITTFGEEGGFQGADRLIRELEDYYAQNLSWRGIEGYIHNTMDSGTMGHGQGRGPGGGFMPMMSNGFALVDTDAKIIFNQNLDLNSDISPDMLEFALPIDYQGEPVAYLITNNSSFELNQTISESLSGVLRESMLPAVAISGMSALLLALLFGYALNRPIQKLTHAAEQLAQGDLSQRVETGGTDEISQLGETFNHMAASLQGAQENRRAMTADIAHELRTPLAVQRANLEALEDGVYPLSKENLAPIAQQNQLLTQLVEDLRTLALTDSGTLELEKNQHDLIALIQEVIDNTLPQFNQQKIELNYTYPENCRNVTLDARRITQVINNLLQNALKFTPAGGQILIQLSCNEKVAKVKITDSGAGIPTEALPHIFDRFYRADHSRARDKGGSGLGLTIAKGLIAAHGGTLTAENAPQVGAVFTITLPYE